MSEIPDTFCLLLSRDRFCNSLFRSHSNSVRGATPAGALEINKLKGYNARFPILEIQDFGKILGLSSYHSRLKILQISTLYKYLSFEKDESRY